MSQYFRKAITGIVFLSCIMTAFPQKPGMYVDNRYLMAAANIELTIFDMNGKKISVIKQDNSPAGENLLRWNPEILNIRLSNAIFLYRAALSGNSGINYLSGTIIKNEK